VLVPAAGEPLAPRTELGSASRSVGMLATLAHVTDAHVLDAQSPVRVTFLDRLGPPFQSTFRPHETLTAQVLTGALRAVRSLGPDAVIQGGDLIDNDQANELALALAVMHGGTARPDSGRPGYFGVQSPFDADPFYYRPDLDAPRHPGLLQSATSRFTSPGVGGAWYSALGDHDILVAGEIAPTPQTRAFALGDQAVWDMPPGLTAPPGLVSGEGLGAGVGLSPDGPPNPGLINDFLALALRAPKVQVPADPRRRQLDPPEVVRRLGGGSGAWLDYGVDVGSRVRVLVLDLVRRGGGSGGLVHPGQAEWLAGELSAAGRRWVVVVSHQPLTSAQGGAQVLAVLDRDPRVIAAISGHIHRNLILARQTEAGGYWLISTASLIDYPQQARAMRLLATADGGVAIQTWMLDHVFPGSLGTISRQLAYLDAQGGRPQEFGGSRWDRNATLYRAAVTT
jgi:3',5'-cyclic AMP phosphodiesterase CpdA